MNTCCLLACIIVIHEDYPHYQLSFYPPFFYWCGYTLYWRQQVKSMLSSVLGHCWLGSRKGIRPVKNKGDGGGGHWLVWMEWRPAGWLMCLPLLIFPCTINSRSSLLAPAHPGSPGKMAVKLVCVCVCVILCLCYTFYRAMDMLWPDTCLSNTSWWSVETTEWV